MLNYNYKHCIKHLIFLIYNAIYILLYYPNNRQLISVKTRSSSASTSNTRTPRNRKPLKPRLLRMRLRSRAATRRRLMSMRMIYSRRRCSRWTEKLDSKVIEKIKGGKRGLREGVGEFIRKIILFIYKCYLYKFISFLEGILNMVTINLKSIKNNIFIRRWRRRWVRGFPLKHIWILLGSLWDQRLRGSVLGPDGDLWAEGGPRDRAVQEAEEGEEDARQD